MADEPIIDPGYIGGMKVVDIGDLRVARGLTRRPASACKHRSVAYDQNERRIWCGDCESDVDAFDVFIIITEYFDAAQKRLDRRAKEISEAEAFALRSLAAKAIDKAWRSRTMIPTCPSCGDGLFPEDFKNGVGCNISREFAAAQRNKRRTKK